MSILRHAKLKNSTPNVKNSPVPRFIESLRKTLDIPVYDQDGKLVQTIRRKVVERKFIDQKEFLNEGIDCDMFSIDNLQRAGINPQLIQTPLIKATLEERSIVSDYIEGIDYDALIETKKDGNGDAVLIETKKDVNESKIEKL